MSANLARLLNYMASPEKSPLTKVEISLFINPLLKYKEMEGKLDYYLEQKGLIRSKLRLVSFRHGVGRA